MAEITETVIREAPEIEAYKLGLLKSGKALADKGVELPPQLVAELTRLQLQGVELTEDGIGNYTKYLEGGQQALADSQLALGATMAQAAPFQQSANNLMATAAGNVPAQTAAAQLGQRTAVGYGADATSGALQDLGAATAAAQGASTTGQRGMSAASGLIPGVVAGGAAGNLAALAQAQNAVNAASQQGVATTLGQNLEASTQAARASAAQTGAAGIGAYETALGGGRRSRPSSYGWGRCGSSCRQPDCRRRPRR